MSASPANLEALMKVRTVLLSLQKELLEHAKVNFEKENARSVAPAEWLQVLMVSQRYTWMRELTTMITDIDILSELQNVTEEQLQVVRAEVERMFFTGDASGEFAKHYRQMMSAEAPFMLTQGKLKEANNALPASPTALDPLTTAAARKIWHEQHKTQSRMRRS